MKRSVTILLFLPAALILAACPADDRGVQQEPVPGMPGEPAVVDAAAGPVDLGTQYLVRLDPVAAPGPAGTLAFSPAGDRTRADVRIENAPTQGLHEGEIRSGTSCDDMGASIADLPAVSVMAGGTGEGYGVLPRPLAELMNGNTVAVYYAPDQRGGDPMFCGGIPLMP